MIHSSEFENPPRAKVPLVDVQGIASVGALVDDPERTFARLQEIIVTLRNLRNEYKADPKKKLTVSILASGESANQVNANRELIELLAGCAIRSAGPDVRPPAEPLIGFHAGSKSGRWLSKRWPHFAKLAARLGGRGIRVASFGTPDE